jgi:hypothetical protein
VDQNLGWVRHGGVSGRNKEEQGGAGNKEEQGGTRRSREQGGAGREEQGGARRARERAKWGTYQIDGDLGVAPIHGLPILDQFSWNFVGVFVTMDNFNFVGDFVVPNIQDGLVDHGKFSVSREKGNLGILDCFRMEHVG